MLVIRFQRIGRKNDPAFRIVVTEKRSKPKATGIELLGSFRPKTKETRINRERILYWLMHGAKASARVHNLLASAGVISAKKINVSKRPSGSVQIAKDTSPALPTEKAGAPEE